jgi:hypothetical protein
MDARIKAGARVLHTPSGETVRVVEIERAWAGKRREDPPRIKVQDASGRVQWTSEVYLLPG